MFLARVAAHILCVHAYHAHVRSVMLLDNKTVARPLLVLQYVTRNFYKQNSWQRDARRI